MSKRLSHVGFVTFCLELCGCQYFKCSEKEFIPAKFSTVLQEKYKKVQFGPV